MKPSIIQNFGYTWLSLPKEGVYPLQLLESTVDNFFKRININFFSGAEEVEIVNADIFSIFPKPKRGAAVKIGMPKKVSFFKGFDILDVKASLRLESSGIPLVGKLSSSTKLNNATKVLYSFKNPNQIDLDNMILLEEHLNITKPIKSAVGFVEKLNSGKLFIITEVLQTNEFSVEDASDFNLGGKLEVDEALNKYLNIKTDASKKKENEQKIGYKGELPVTFAIKASKILYNSSNNTYSLNKVKLKTTRHDAKFDPETSDSSYSTHELLVIE